MTVPAVPVFLRVSGLYEVDYQVSIACRDSCIYTIKDGGRVPKYRIALGSQACGMQKMEQSVVVACMNQTLASYTVKVGVCCCCCCCDVCRGVSCGHTCCL